MQNMYDKLYVILGTTIRGEYTNIYIVSILKDKLTAQKVVGILNDRSNSLKLPDKFFLIERNINTIYTPNDYEDAFSTMVRRIESEDYVLLDKFLSEKEKEGIHE